MAQLKNLIVNGVARIVGKVFASEFVGNLSWSNITGKPSTYTPSDHTHSYLPLSGGTMSGLVTGYIGNNAGMKLGSAYITSANSTNGEIVLQNGHLRFGTSAWDYNQWAGLRYNHSSKTISLGLADGSTFTANSSQSGGTVNFPGVSVVAAQTFKATSDYNLKENFVELSNVDWSSVKTYKYNFKNESVDVKHIGLIAQEIQRILPEAVSTMDDHLILDYNAVVATLVTSVKTQNMTIKQLESRIDSLEKQSQQLNS